MNHLLLDFLTEDPYIITRLVVYVIFQVISKLVVQAGNE